ncbi:chemotaxis protein CheA [Oleiphilus sp. HI0071]|uniref:chemotaxis protein CheA n=1 Tax=Oleiphilus sp. HI0080 TaxID=1822255 RepID=UPI0007C24182|nr:chemotaxis protein CheA [Oleiphilus sp. HI0080]KZY74938.1 chemotaxis protein CheA [Oleiphilus sp. HI0065]KZY83952.1 chemotaxis protein CheA [Oleiphilus sp. HI0071]KZY91108.1 chemotaxis protein CheA [Oleiphilus sp. HI0073]KZZ42131.1 chemotaxis protein CheA [Oleiphilus sp. HI0118]KZZ60422.1 chemotaxis protein CheA [Oleiphilus sp. HI0122]KZZ81935.1 chemotaxis protein CheA [Oleiphilus sp. HI0133]
MSFEADEEILQDFLVESGEILEQLSEQLVSLEQNPEDKDLLNAIFRGFHTVKGGAGFLQLEALVGCCHIAENVFDVLRNGKRVADAELMDVVLRALDTVNVMFDEVRSGQEPTPAEPELLEDLERFATEQGSEPEPAAAEEPPAEDEPATPQPDPQELVNQIASADGDITDDEFEMLLDALDGPSGAAAAQGASDKIESSAPAASDISQDEFSSLIDELHEHQVPSDKTSEAASDSAPKQEATSNGESSDEITDDEFEKLLDELHGEGQFDPAKADDSAAADASTASPSSAAGGSNSELITDDEFEKLLDDLHGSGKGPATDGAAAAKVEAPAPASAKSEPETAKPTPPPAKPKAPAAASKPAPPAKTAADKPKAPAPRNEGLTTETTVRVDTSRLDEIMNMVGELVLVRNRLKRLGDDSTDEALQKAVSNLDVVTGDLQSAVMKTRMQPIKKVFGRFPRVVRDLARNLRKEVNLVLQGEDTDLDKNLVEALSDPLVHLVRNAVDHGIEMPDVRESNGKPRLGEVLLSAEQEGDHILLSIRDDGAGMDPNVLRRKAVEKGVYDQDAADRLSDNECYNLIFAPGFSTKEEISDVSGRGVGMDVVKTKITQLNGSVNIDSELGKGSCLTIKVPLTLAIMPTLMVKLEQQAFAFPLVSVVEIFHLDLTKTNIVDGQECVVVRDNVYPLFYIKRWLVNQSGETDPQSAHVVIVAVGTKKVGFIVDQLVGQEEVVIKPLGGMLHGTPGMAGATITGDGRIALILDIPSLLTRYA